VATSRSSELHVTAIETADVLLFDLA
jgi:hypothetical protein